jgi:hypothetical protein
MSITSIMSMGKVRLKQETACNRVQSPDLVIVVVGLLFPGLFLA